VFPIYLTYSIWNWAIGKRGVGYVTLFNYAVPVMSGVVGFFVLREGLTLPQLAGGALVIGGMLLARRGVLSNQRVAAKHAQLAQAAQDALASAAAATGMSTLTEAGAEAPTSADPSVNSAEPAYHANA
ncbi:MAG TPA: DMT family transporter, partial [Ktedonobacterales bacterium]|nr:DMT family transporter [Ktedonobacterales bacterium]